MPIIDTELTLIASSASASFTSTPAAAPRPVPTMIDIGVARPSAHGHAMISTATAFTNASAGLESHHTANVTISTPITAGTKRPATLRAATARRTRGFSRPFAGANAFAFPSAPRE